MQLDDAPVPINPAKSIGQQRIEDSPLGRILREYRLKGQTGWVKDYPLQEELD